MANKNPPPQNDSNMTASLLNGYLTDRNPFQALVGDVGHMINVIANLGKTRKVAQMRIEQLQQQASKVEFYIDAGNPKTAGTRIDRLR